VVPEGNSVEEGQVQDRIHLGVFDLPVFELMDDVVRETTFFVDLTVGQLPILPPLDTLSAKGGHVEVDGFHSSPAL